ncbi:MAG: SsrA-binding protein SmpB [Actinomycetota bacterium]|nr:SsrA-binding protein SmpB [Actinomycetota bacterium]
MAKKKKGASEAGVAASNPKARHNYTILDSMEAGIVLTGSEVKSLRQGRASLREAFGVIQDGEVYLIGMHIPPYAQAGYAQHEPTRKRKLLLRKEEIERLMGKTAERGLTLVPMKCYFKHGLAKIELGLAKGKRLYDKREDLKAKDAKMQVDRAMGRRR